MVSTRFRTLVALLAIFAMSLAVAIAQETTGGLQGTVKDPSGAVVSHATVTVTSPALIGDKTLSTDAGGYYRFANLPPGTYTLTVTAQNFSSYKQDGITIETGHLPTIDITLKVGAASETVQVSGEAPIVDVTQSKVQTNLTNDVINEVPKGRSYQSMIAFAPGARAEPLQGYGTVGNDHGVQNGANGFAIDGASNSENAYLVEGQETASVFDGSSAANVPTDFIQEVQIKSSGFEAEYGGALGGVVNVIQKRGSNEWHGDIFTYYTGDAFNANDNPSVRNNPGTKSSTATRTPQAPEVFQTKKDHYRIVEPGFDLGGYLVKNRLWVFASSVPRISQTARTVNFASNAPVPGARTFHDNVDTYYSMSRVDFLATSKIRLFGSWQYGYERGTGTSLPGADSSYGQVNTSATSNVDNFNGGIGYVAPNVIYGTGADITLTPNLVSTTRFGYFYQDYEDRGRPSGIQYAYRDTNYPYSTGNATKATAGFVALDGTPMSSTYFNSTGWTNIGANSQTVFDKFKRWSFNQDLAYFKKGWGTHNFKVGYAFNHNYNDILNGYNTADVYVGYGLAYTPLTTVGNTNCTSIIAANVAAYGAGAAAQGCQGDWGTVNLREFGTTGKVADWNHALYVQDAWTLGHGITLNLGVRFDKENLPSYAAGFKGIDFGWGQKVAPRLGGAWDVLGNGKVKIYGSFGYFYDIMKLQLPRGSFGGDYWHDCVYALDAQNFNQIAPQRDANNHYCEPGGSTPATGSFPAMRFIENVDYREPANDPASFQSLGPTGLVDPNLKPMKQHEMVVGTDWELSPTMAFEARYSRKRLDRTIEDAGVITPNGEQYYITNPGEGINTTVPSYLCSSCPPNPKANRSYDGLEFRLTKRGGGRWFGAASYTYSRLYGNYAGLTASDASDGIGRNGANTDRAFDESYMQFDSHGKVIDGPLATDRPHTLKAYGYYNLKWWRFNTMVGGLQIVESGTPLSTYMSVWGAPVFLEGRGNWANITRDGTGNWVLNGVSARRTPLYAQTDFSMVHEMHVSKSNERLVAAVEANITNIFNQHSPVSYNGNLIGGGGANYITPYPANNSAGFDYGKLIGGYNYIAAANDPTNKTPFILNGQYGMANLWQLPRSMRFRIRFTF